jgi:hypothetical protein
MILGCMSNDSAVELVGAAEAGAMDSRILAEGHCAAEPAAIDSHSMHVLLVDDDTLARHVVRKALEKFGYQGVMLHKSAPLATPQSRIPISRQSLVNGTSMRLRCSRGGGDVAVLCCRKTPLLIPALNLSLCCSYRGSQRTAGAAGVRKHRCGHVPANLIGALLLHCEM